ncbi:MAG: hypothetical protein KAG53_05110 [Endozoicomonadaceae bacterium]|nr:hypothetical protein [Endozoicomonadaceae bacterium]
MLVVSEHMSQAPNDKKEIEPALSLPQELGAAEDFLADTGYFSTANVQACITSGIKPSIATGRDQHNLSVFERFAPDLALEFIFCLITGHWRYGEAKQLPLNKHFRPATSMINAYYFYT